MPNWCTTDIKIVCKKEEYAKDIYDTLCLWNDTEIPGHSDVGKNWLGKFLIHAGLTTYEEINTSGYSCRGTIECIEHLGCEVTFSTETAWSPSMCMWLDIFEKCWPDKVEEILYVADEPGCRLHLTNNPEYETAYYAYCVPNDECEFDLMYERYDKEELRAELMGFFAEKGIAIDNDDLGSLKDELFYFGVELYTDEYEYADVSDLN